MLTKAVKLFVVKLMRVHTHLLRKDSTSAPCGQVAQHALVLSSLCSTDSTRLSVMAVLRLTARVHDTDGEFLLIEAATAIPPFLSPANR